MHLSLSDKMETTKTTTTTETTTTRSTATDLHSTSTPSANPITFLSTPSNLTFLLSTFEPNLTSLNLTNSENEDKGSLPHALTMTISMTIIYILITITGVLGNVATCVVIVRNRIMHTATNYYLFSMAISDLLLLAFGMPDDLYLLWRGAPYIFGPQFCFLRGFTAEISTNASILTIAAFTVERYIGICHPLRSHTMSQLGRVVRSIAVIWIVATACAVPIAIQYGIIYHKDDSGEDILSLSMCGVKKLLYMAFEMSTLLFFIAPLLLITVLYILIAIQLKRSSRLSRAVPSISAGSSSSTHDGSARNKAVIKMLVAVVIAFFLCFAPHQAQRLMALHGNPNNPITQITFNILHNISGVSYYISTCVNPILYHIMSNRFRQALRATLSDCFGKGGTGGRLRSQPTQTFELTEHPDRATHTSSHTPSPTPPSRYNSSTTIYHQVNPHNLQALKYSPEKANSTQSIRIHFRNNQRSPTFHKIPLENDSKTTAFSGDAPNAESNSSLNCKKNRPRRAHRIFRSLHNGVRSVGGGHKPSHTSPSRKSRGLGVSKLRPLFKSKVRKETVKEDEDVFAASTSTPISTCNPAANSSPSRNRKRSQSGSLLSGGSISSCSMTHVEEEFTRKELSEVMARMKNLEG